MFNQGDILIVPFPFSDLSTIRQRPVLVLSNSIYNNHSEDIVTCGITSNLKDTDYSILIDNMNLLEGNLAIKSKIKADKIFTLHKNIVIKKIGRLNQETLKKVKSEIYKIM